MSNYKGPTEGGNGGKRGNTNMEHWVTTEEIKQSSKIQRRINNKQESKNGIEEYKKNEKQ